KGNPSHMPPSARNPLSLGCTPSEARCTFARYLNTPNGTPYGYQVRIWDSILPRTMNLEKERTVKGLRFCGAHSERMDGYSSAYFSGEGTAKKTIEDMKEGK
ncbi:MAG: hypothetical protein ACQGQO_11550, partial [Sphaerochaetaceae bacterium]